MALRLLIARAGISPGARTKVGLAGIGLAGLSVSAGHLEQTTLLLASLPVAWFGDLFLLAVPDVEPNYTTLYAILGVAVIAVPMLAVTVELLAGDV